MISDRADHCPHCGYSFRNDVDESAQIYYNDEEPQAPKKTKWVLIGVIALLVILAAIGLYFINSGPKPDEPQITQLGPVMDTSAVASNNDDMDSEVCYCDEEIAIEAITQAAEDARLSSSYKKLIDKACQFANADAFGIPCSGCDMKVNVKSVEIKSENKATAKVVLLYGEDKLNEHMNATFKMILSDRQWYIDDVSWSGESKSNRQILKEIIAAGDELD